MVEFYQVRKEGLPKTLRARAMGIWQLSVGFGVLGSVTLGAVAEEIGASLAQSLYGAVMVIIFVLLVLFMPKLREL